jgi:phosphoesterase RecJ-like protein
MLDQVLALLLEKQRFVLTTHTRPDGDAAGSLLAMGRWLHKLGKHVTLMTSDPLPYNLGWLPEAGTIDVYDSRIRQVEQIVKADVCILLDTNTQERIGRHGQAWRDAPGVKVLIDHHPFPENWFEVVYRREEASSTGELLYDLIEAHDLSAIDAELATTLYTAIMTDTGSFRFSNVNPRVHRIIAEVLERGGIAPTPIHQALFDTRSLHGLRLLARVLDTMTVLYDGQIAYLKVTQAMLRDAGADLDETEGVVNYPLSVEGIRVALMFIETEKGTKVSWRSKDDNHVHEWAQAFGGGGHRNASGAFVKRPLEPVLREVLAAAPRFIRLTPADTGNGSLSPEDLHLLSSFEARKAQKKP